MHEVKNSQLRSFVERCSRGVILKRRLPSRFGGHFLYVTPESALRFWRRDLGKAFPDLFRWAEDYVRQGMTVWDVGANVGIFAFAAAYVAGPTGCVVGIEADTWLVDFLRRSAGEDRATSAQVTILPIAVADRVGISRFALANRCRASSHLVSIDGSSQSGGTRAEVQVITVTLDWLLEHLPAPHCVKIDVEGAEWLVLQGAQHLLQQCRPTLLVEVSQPNAERVGKLLLDFDYTAHRLNDPQRRCVFNPSGNVCARPVVSCVAH